MCVGKNIDSELQKASRIENCLKRIRSDAKRRTQGASSTPLRLRLKGSMFHGLSVALRKKIPSHVQLGGIFVTAVVVVAAVVEHI